eukprot:494298-Pyramimonas_sp.AAC.1
MERGLVHSIQWRDTRDMTADGHGETEFFKHDLKRRTLYRAGQATSSEAACMGSTRLQSDLLARQL